MKDSRRLDLHQKWLSEVEKVEREDQGDTTENPN